MTVTVTRDSVKQTLEAIRSLTLNRVLVGIPSSTATREPDPEDPQPIDNATIGYLMENGSPANNIPERPFLVPGVAAVDDEIADRYRAGADAVMTGRASSLDATHTTVGIIAENSVKRKITMGPFAPLAPATLAERKRRGREGERPLIDTGQLRRAVTHVVRPRNA